MTTIIQNNSFNYKSRVLSIIAMLFMSICSYAQYSGEGTDVLISYWNDDFSAYLIKTTDIDYVNSALSDLDTDDNGYQSVNFRIGFDVDNLEQNSQLYTLLTNLSDQSTQVIEDFILDYYDINDNKYILLKEDQSDVESVITNIFDYSIYSDRTIDTQFYVSDLVENASSSSYYVKVVANMQQGDEYLDPFYYWFDDNDDIYYLNNESKLSLSSSSYSAYDIINDINNNGYFEYNSNDYVTIHIDFDKDYFEHKNYVSSDDGNYDIFKSFCQNYDLPIPVNYGDAFENIENNVITISSYQQLVHLSRLVSGDYKASYFTDLKEENIEDNENFWNNYKIVIDYSSGTSVNDFCEYELETTEWNCENGEEEPTEWVPIGTEENPFCGEFTCYDGEGNYTFIPSVIAGTLFGYLGKGAKIHDVVISDVYKGIDSCTPITVSGENVGAIANHASENVTIENCICSVVDESGELLPIVGAIDDENVTIKECFNVKADDFISVNPYSKPLGSSGSGQSNDAIQIGNDIKAVLDPSAWSSGVNEEFSIRYKVPLHYELTCDIDFANGYRFWDKKGVINSNSSSDFETIGAADGISSYYRFCGVLDGKGHTISGMNNYLFYSMEGATIKNLGIVNFNGKNAFCNGVSSDPSTIECCYVEAQGVTSLADENACKAMFTTNTDDQCKNCYISYGTKNFLSHDTTDEFQIAHIADNLEDADVWVDDAFTGNKILRSTSYELKDPKTNTTAYTDACVVLPNNNVVFELKGDFSKLTNLTNYKDNICFTNENGDISLNNFFLQDYNCLVDVSSATSSEEAQSMLNSANLVLGNAEGCNAENIYYKRKDLSGHQWNTFCLPFAYSASDITYYDDGNNETDGYSHSLLAFCGKRTGYGNDNDAIYYTFIYSDNIRPGQGALMGCEHDNHARLLVLNITSGAKITAVPSYKEGYDVDNSDENIEIDVDKFDYFRGCLSLNTNAVSLGSKWNADVYKIGPEMVDIKEKTDDGNCSNWSGHLYKCVSGSWIYPFRSYLILPSTEGREAKVRFINLSDIEETAIKELTLDNIEASPSGAIYSITGTLVNATGDRTALAPGLYIQGGKKFVVR